MPNTTSGERSTPSLCTDISSSAFKRSKPDLLTSTASTIVTAPGKCCLMHMRLRHCSHFHHIDRTSQPYQSHLEQAQELGLVLELD